MSAWAKKYNNNVWAVQLLRLGSTLVLQAQTMRLMQQLISSNDFNWLGFCFKEKKPNQTKCKLPSYGYLSSPIQMRHIFLSKKWKTKKSLFKMIDLLLFLPDVLQSVFLNWSINPLFMGEENSIQINDTGLIQICMKLQQPLILP